MSGEPPARLARTRSRGRDLRLVPAAVLAWATGAVLVGVPGASGVVVLISVGVAGGSLVAAIAVRRGPLRTALAALAFAVGASSLVAMTVLLRADIRSPPGLGAERGPVDVVIVTTEEAERGSDRVRGIALRLGALDAQAPALVVGTRLEAGVGIGATLRLRGVVTAVEPGATLAALIVAEGDAPEVIEPPPGWIAWGNDLRAGFRELAAGLPGGGGALVPGLAIGDDRDVDRALADAMRASSLTHLTAVSGANCAIVVGGVMVGGALLGIRRRLRIVAALIVLAAFVVLVTPQPSVVRAAVMAAFALVGLAASRPMRGLPLLALAVVGILVLDPWAAREFGFILSALATAGLLVLSGPLGRLLGVAMPQALATALAVPLAAQLACQPAIALLDPGLPTYGVAANLLAVPAAPLATVAGLFACLLAPFASPIAQSLAWVAWLPSSWIAGVATAGASLPAARLPWVDGLGGVLLYALLAAFVGLGVLGRGRTRLVGGLGAAAFVVGYLGAVLSWQATGAIGRPQDWQIAMCDIGQGDAAVVRSAGEVAVIDTGPEPEALRACLEALGVARVDLLILSHFDHDHIGGVAAVVGRVDRVLIGPADGRADARVVQPLAAGGASVESARRGDAGTLGALIWRVLWPRSKPAIEPGNAASVVVRFDAAAGAADSVGCPSGGCITSVFLGDLGEVEQSRLLGLGPVGRVDVVKVSHHGSADQSERLYGALSASIGLIGVGRENEYGHPTDRLLGILARTGTTAGRTDSAGLLLVATNADGLVLWRERGG